MTRAVYNSQSPNRKTAIGKRREAVSGENMQFDDAMLESELDAMIRTRVEDTANAMPDASGRRDRQRREIRTNRRTQAFRAGRCGRGPRVPEPRGALFESAVIERHRRRGSGVEEALTEMYPAGVSTRRVDGTGQLPWDDRMPSQTPSDRLEHVCAGIDGRGNARWGRSARACSWTACGASVPGAGAWGTSAY